MILRSSKKGKGISAFKYMGMFRVAEDERSSGYDKRSENNYSPLLRTQKVRRRKK